MKPRASAALLAALANVSAQAQGTPPEVTPGPQIQRLQQRQVEAAKAANPRPDVLTPDPGGSATPDLTRLPTDTPCFRIDELVVHGNAFDWLPRALQPVAGQCVGKSALKHIQDTANNALIARLRDIACAHSAAITRIRRADPGRGAGAGKRAERDVNLNAGEQSASAFDERYRRERGVLSSKSTHTRDSASYTNAIGTTLSGRTAAVSAGDDLTGAAATIAATGDVQLDAIGDLTFSTAQTVTSESHFKDVRKSGFGSAGVGISYGSSRTMDRSRETVMGEQGSLIGSTGGSVRMRAGNQLNVTGSDLIAAQDVTGAGRNVTIDASQTHRQYEESHEARRSGFSLGMKSAAIDSVRNVNHQAHKAGESRDGRAAALYAIAAAGGALDAFGEVGKATQALSAGKRPEVRYEFSWGSSRSKSRFSEESVAHNGSSVEAGGVAALEATGDGTPGTGNVTIMGSDVSAQNISLKATNQVNLLSRADEHRTRSTNESRGTGVGVDDRAAGNVDSVTRNNTHFDASGTATIISGGECGGG